jgi:hypothetical protein
MRLRDERSSRLHRAPHPVVLSDIGYLNPAQAERLRKQALRQLRTARGQERQRWAEALLLSDSHLGREGEPAFEDRLALAKAGSRKDALQCGRARPAGGRSSPPEHDGRANVAGCCGTSTSGAAVDEAQRAR